MRKNIEWLKMTITNLDLNEGLSPKESGNELLGAFRNTVLDFIDQLEEPDITEEQAWNKIELENSYHLAPAHTKVYKEAIQNGVKPECFNKPEKPVIPQFVADWIERNKQPDYEYENKEDALADSIHFTLYSLEANYPETNPNVILRKPVNEWLDNDRKNYWKLIDGVRYGYEVEKEKLYKVELPTERLHHILTMHGDGKGHFFGKEHTNNFWYRTYLTEQEIKEIDPRYWVFAEEVTK